MSWSVCSLNNSVVALVRTRCSVPFPALLQQTELASAAFKEAVGFRFQAVLNSSLSTTTPTHERVGWGYFLGRWGTLRKKQYAHAAHVACLCVNHAARNPMVAWQTHWRHAIGLMHRHSRNGGVVTFRCSSTSLSLIGQRCDPWALQHLLFSSRSSQSTSWKPRRVVVSLPSC